MASCQHVSFLISNRLLKPAKNNRHAMIVRMSSEGLCQTKTVWTRDKTFKNVTC